MARRTLPALFRSWAFDSKNLGRRSRDAVVLGLETFEDRVVPATLPTPTVVSPTATSAPTAANNAINPQVVADPTNVLNQVLVATTVNGTTLGGVLRVSTDGGQTWGGTTTLTRPRDPMLAATANPNLYTDASSPAVAVGRDGQVYVVYLAHNAAKTSGAVLFARAGTVGGALSAPVVLHQWTGADPALNPAIAVDNNLGTFTDPDTGVTFTDTMATRTTGRQAVYVAWNGNAATNPGDITTPASNYNPNPILSAVSADNGATWSQPVPVNNGGYMTSPTNARGAAPQIVISPGTAGTPGALVFVWPQASSGTANSRIGFDVSRPDNGLVTTYLPQVYSAVGGAGPIGDATVPPASPPPPPNTPDVSNTTTFNLTIPAGTIPAADTGFQLRDLSIGLAIESQQLGHLLVELVAPNGTTTIQLLTPRLDGLGAAVAQGSRPFAPGLPAPPATTGSGLGLNNGTTTTRTIFSDNAARKVNDPGAQFPYIGTFRPEGSTFTSQTTPTRLIGAFLNSAGLNLAGGAAINGTTWTLRVTDVRNDRVTPATAQNLIGWNLTFSSVANNFGTDDFIAGTTAPPLGGFDFNNGGLTTASSGVVIAPTGTGILPAVSVAFDQSLGSFSPFRGSLYVTYTGVATGGDTDIRVARGTVSGGALTFGTTVRVNDDTRFDNWTEGNRPQFTPAVTVDAITGTVVATWYDARLDANLTRAATFVATSTDGGATWSDQTLTTAETANTRTSPFLNQPKEAVDFITGTVYSLQPVPTNVPQAGAFGLGIRQSVIASGGTIYAYWAGNLNAAGSSIQAARAVTAGGPRVIAGDTGAVLTSSGGYNTAVRADGTRGLDGIRVVFDRGVNAVAAGHPEFAGSALNPANYVIRYHNPYDPVGVDTVFAPTAVAALGGNAFLMQFPARFEVGTYSYSVSNVRDRVRTATAGGVVLTTGNPMDQDADAVEGEINFDSFAMPTPVSGVPFSFPYVTSSLPLIIPGPYMTGSSVPNRSAGDEDLVNAGVATAVDVTFDRDINTNPAAGPVFTRANVVRITGPAGVLYDRSAFFTAAATATVSPGGQVTGVTVTTGGGGYPAPPIVVLTGTGTGATARATVVNGVVTAVTILTPGTGYTTAPLVTFLDPISVTQPDPSNDRSFRIGFPPQVLSGTYTVEVDAQFAGAVGLGAGRPVLIDSNQNAGVSVLRGGDPTAGVASTSSYSANFSGAAATIPAAVAGVPGQAEFPLVVPDAFAIALSNGRVPSVLLNVSSTAAVNNRVVDLVAELIAPDGTVIRLFTNVGQATGRPLGTQWFANTTLIDTANTPIQSGFQPFSAGPYTPQFPLSDLAGRVSNGTWRLRITNGGTETPRLNTWGLSLPQISGGTGLGQDAADRFAVSFRVFNQDPTDPLTQKTWTPVGPAAENGQANSSRTNAIAVDPSDPSGNTVFLGGASGGLWKTKNFLTMDAGGPTWVPLTDSGPTYSLNVVSIALFPRNNDPNQTIVFAITGEGDAGTPGVGLLRSMDGGKTWNVLDSLNNADTPAFGGNLTPITAASRDRTFFGKTAFEVIVDPTPVADADQNVIVYAAFGGANGGVYRSVDTGRHWTLMRQGNATDIVLAEGSNAVGTGLLQILYAAFRGEGVYRANPAYVAASMVQLTGTPPGNGSFVDGDVTLADRVEINAPGANPNGAKGRILLATPARTNNRADDLNYQGWLYALVVAPNDSFDGLYVTKDFGGNWTRVLLPELLVPATGIPLSGHGTNNFTRPQHDVFASPPGSVGALPGQGNYDVGFAIDPNNPNVVYIGGTNNNAIGPNGAMIRVDTTGLLDAGAVVAYDNSLPGVNDLQFAVGTGNVSTKAGGVSETTGATLGPGQPYGFRFPSISGTNTGYLNVLRDPTNPFNTSATFLAFTNVDRILNTGRGARYSGFPAEVNTDVHRIITIVDPLTGGTRLLVADDQGIASAVDDGKGNLILSVGNSTQRQNLPGLVRNGNLQTVQFYSSAVQPGQLAAEIASAMFYGEAQDNGFPVSNPDILLTGVGTAPGKLSWSGGAGDGTWGLTDQTGTGTYYDYKWPCCGGGGENFFQVNGAGRTFGLVQPGDNPTVGTGNWPLLGGSKFAVNPIDPNGILMSSSVTGRLFRTVDQGITWFQVAGPDTGYLPLGGYAPAVAFGAPDVNQTQAQFNNFLYAGVGSTVWVSFDGGTSWIAHSTGLSGAVQQIVPDPARGSKAAYVVTSNGVFFKANTDPSQAGVAWTNITGNIFSITDPIFSDPNAAPQTGVPATLRSLTSLAVDWRYAIPDAGGPSAFFPILYAGGDGGIVRSLDRGRTWQIYPVASTHTTDYVDQTTGAAGTVVTAIPNGGYFPSTQVTQLSLSFGNIDPTTGLPLQQTGGLNMLTAGTYGRGTWVIRLEDLRTNPNPAIAALADFQVVQQSGPKVIGVGGTGSPNQFFVEFDAPVLASTFTTADFRMTDAAGNPLQVIGVVALSNSDAPFGAPPLPVAALDYHNLFLVTVAPVFPATTVAPGFATVTIGPDAANPGRASIADYAGFGMNQDGDNRNGETAADPNKGGAAADAYRGFVFVPPLTTPSVTPLADFSDGAGGLSLDGFTATGLWHPTADPAVGATLAGHTAPEIAYYGIDATATYNDGLANTGTLTSGPILLPVGNVALTFNHRLVTESSLGFDAAEVQVSTDGVFFTTVVSRANGDFAQAPAWTPVSIDMRPFAGQTVFVRFRFDTGDDFANDFLGWQIDDVAVSVSPTVFGNLHLNMPVVTTAGEPTRVVVTAIDPNTGLPDGGYRGTVRFDVQNDPLLAALGLPADYTFTAGDAGTHAFTIVFKTATAPSGPLAPQTLLSVSDTAAGINDARAAITVNPGLATHFRVAGFPDPTVAGVAGSITVTALDLFDNVAPSYAGTVTFTSTDLAAGVVLPASYTFTSADAGVHTFAPPDGVTLTTAGVQTITATDATNPNITLTGAQTVLVVPAQPATVLLSGLPATTVAGTALTVTVRLEDAFGNLATNYTGTVSFTSTDLGTSTVLPPTYTFTSGPGLDNGIHTFTGGIVLTTVRTTPPGTQSVTVSTNTTPAASATQAVTVTPAAPTQVFVTGFPNPVTAGVFGSVTVTLRDQFNNLATNYTGTVSFTSTDVGAQTVLPPTYTFTSGPGRDNGVRVFTNGVRLTTAGLQSITVSTPGGATGSQSNIQVNAAAAATLAVTGFSTPVVAGTPGSVTVTLRDQFGNLATGFGGTVTFTSTDTNPATVLPAAYTFTGADGGTRTFTGVTLTTATGTATFPGTHTITATSGALTGNQGGIVVTPAATSRYSVTGFPNPVTAGTIGDVTVTARDQYGNITPAYTGTVHFTSTDAGPMSFFPADYTFTAGDAGVHTFTSGVRLTIAGTQSITATDTANALITGTQGPILVTAAAADTLTVSGFPSSVVAGVPGTITVTLRDQFGNLATGFTGAVSFTSTDTGAQTVLPPTYTFTGADGGTRTFTGGVTLTTATGTATFPGTHTITATATATPTLTGSQTSIEVTPAATSRFDVGGVPSPIAAGTPATLTVTARDRFGNLTPAYAGTVRFTSTDTKPFTVLPPDYTFVPGTDAGTHTFTNGVTLTTSGTHSITARDTANTTITGTQTGIVVTPGAATQMTVAGFPATVTAGALGSVTVTLLDQFGNRATNYTGTVTFTSTDPAVTAFVPAAYTFTTADAGVRVFTNGVRLTTATGTATFPGTHTITATDGSLTGTQAGIVVTPAAPAQVAVAGFPATVVAGTPGSVTVTLRDQFNNLATDYTGTVSFSSTDAGAGTVLPPTYTFTLADAGVRTFTNGVTLTTAGTHSITATAGAAVGSQTGITVTPDATSQFVLSGFPSTVTAGVAGSLTVTARDRFGNLTPGYAGTVTVLSSDVGTGTVLPAPYTFVPGTDMGVHTFTNGVTLTTAGTQSLTVADGAVLGSQTGITVTPAAVASTAVTGFPTPVTAGVPGSVTVTLRDQFGNLATNYTGTVSFTSTDTGAQTVLPATYTFTGADAGAHTFTNGVTLTTAGTQSITATAGTIVGSQTGITVTPAAASEFVVGGFPTPVAAGTPGALTVTARDRFGNTATGYTGTVRFTSTDTGAQTVLPPNYTFIALDAGVHTFPGVRLTTVGTRAITATDTVTATVTGTQAGIVVTPAAAASVAVTGFPASVVAGTPGGVTVTLRDAFGNLATTFAGTVTFSSSDTGAQTSLPAAYTFTGADAGVRAFPNGVRLTTVGTQSITATTGALAGTQSGITVTPAGAASVALAGLPARIAAGTRATVTVTARDAFGNVATGYGGPLSVTSSDTRAQFPAAVGLSGGVGTFDVVFNTRADQTVRVADPSNGALAATAATDVFFNLAQTFAVGGGTGGSQTVFEYDGTGNPTAAFPNRYGGGSRVVSADFNGDGVPDLAVGAGPGIPSDITVFDGATKAILFTANPFEGFTGGVFLAAGHVSGSGRPELIVTPDQGGGPRVQVYAGGTFTKIADFFGIEDVNFRGGARAAAGDIDGDGFAELVVSAGFQGGPRISVYDGAALSQGRIVHPIGDFFAFEETLRNGAFVAVGDVNGDGFGDMIFGAGPGGGPRVLVVSGQTVMSAGANAAVASPIANLFAGNTANRGGVRVTAKNLDGDGFADVVVGDGEGAGSTVTAYKGVNLSANRTDPLFQFDAFPGINAGVFVG